MKAQIQTLLEEASGVKNVTVEAPKEKTHGDYSSNVALALSKKLEKSPVEVAKEIIAKIGSHKFLEKVEVAGPGFINFYLSKDFFVEQIKGIDKNFGKNAKLKGEKIIIEYTDPNILKEFHIGHLMSNAIGEALSRILEFQGAKIKRVNYQGDVGLHIAKAVWGKLQNVSSTWQEAYVAGNAAYESSQAKQEIVELNKKIFLRSDKKVNALYDQGRKESLKKFDEIYKKLGTKFDRLFFESEVADTGKNLVEKGLEKDIFQVGEKGAVVFKGEKYGLHTRVFLNSEGLPTYEAKDLALPELKYKYFNYDTSIIITAHEQNAYFDVMLAALKELKPELAHKTQHIGHGMLRLPEGKMASRAGKVITAESLIGKAQEMISEKMKEREFSASQMQQVAQAVAIASIKYSILKQAIGSDIIYDFDKSISFEGDSGPYLQYSYARANSVLEKAKKEKVKGAVKHIPDITALEKLMNQFPEVVEEAGKTYHPHMIVLYLTELAREFNNYYANHKIVDATDTFSPYRIALTQAFSIIMKNGLWLLGIEAPEKM